MGIRNRLNNHSSASDVLNDSGIDSLLEPSVGVGSRALIKGIIVLAALSTEQSTELGRVRHGLIGRRQEDDLAVSALGHGLHSLEVPNLHGRRARENVSSLAHQLRGFDLGLGRNDLGLSNTLALGGHGERVLKLRAEDDILDQHGLDLDAPAGRHILDDFSDA